MIYEAFLKLIKLRVPDTEIHRDLYTYPCLRYKNIDLIWIGAALTIYYNKTLSNDWSQYLVIDLKDPNILNKITNELAKAIATIKESEILWK